MQKPSNIRESFRKSVEEDDLGWSSSVCLAFTDCLRERDYAGAKGIAEFEMVGASAEEVDFLVRHWKSKFSATKMDVLSADKAALVADLSDPFCPRWASVFLVRIGKFLGVSRPSKGEDGIKFSLVVYGERVSHGIEHFDELREIVLT